MLLRPGWIGRGLFARSTDYMSGVANTWEGVLVGAVIGVIGTVGAAVANVKAAKHTGDSNIQVAKIEANASDIGGMESRLTFLETEWSKNNELIHTRNMELITAKTNELASKSDAAREKDRADREANRADKAESELVKLNLKLANLRAAFQALLDAVRVPEKNKTHIQSILCDDNEAITQIDIDAIGQR
jgi:hypothetical protein